MYVKTSMMSCHSSIKSQSINFFHYLSIASTTTKVKCVYYCVRACVCVCLAEYRKSPFWIRIYIISLFFRFFTFYRETSLQTGKLVDGISHRIFSVPRYTGLNFVWSQLGLYEEVQSTVWKQNWILQDPKKDVFKKKIRNLNCLPRLFSQYCLAFKVPLIDTQCSSECSININIIEHVLSVLNYLWF